MSLQKVDWTVVTNEMPAKPQEKLCLEAAGVQVCCGGHKGTSRGASLGNEPGSNISWSFPTVLPWSCSQAHVVIILTESVLALSKSGLRILHLSVLRFHRGQEARQDGQFLPLSLPMASVPSFPSSRLSFPPLSFHSFSLHCRGLQTVTRLGGNGLCVG